MSPPLFICAGEPSGDLYASFYIRETINSSPASRFVGVGGTLMEDAGVVRVMTCDELETLGLQTAISSFSRHMTVLQAIKKALQDIHPREFIAVAYPGINLLLCEYASRLGCTVHYLLPPQAWAWGGFRANLVARWVDRVITVFPFEYKFYKQRGIYVEYWENPLPAFLRHFIRTDTLPRLGFMPGSRGSEIRRNLPLIVHYLSYIQSSLKSMRYALILHTPDVITRDPRIAMSIKNLGDMYHDRLEVHTDNHYQHMKNCDFLITCSGTASLEAAFMNIPQVFFNRCSWFDYAFMRPFVKTREYNLANLCYGKTLVPACVSSNDRAIMSFLNGIDIRKIFN